MSKIRYDDDDLREALSFDGLAAAERIEGKSYKESPETEMLGFALHVRNVDTRRRMLESRDDTTFSNKLPRYLSIIQRVGFERAIIVPFTEEREQKEEQLNIWWHPSKAILLVFDTYYGQDVVNGGKFYYNWRPHERHHWGQPLSSGGYDEAGIWAGDHDCREALVFNIEQLDAHGQFVKPWARRPFLWLLHFMDTKQPGYDYNAINAQRIALLPEAVRTAISPNESPRITRER